MMPPLLPTLGFVAVTTIADVFGAWLVVRKLYHPDLLRVLTHFAVGTLLAFTFLDLLPEALEESSITVIFPVTLAGLLGFYILEHLTASYHCTDEHCIVHRANARGRQAVILIGASVEEFIDGAAIGLAVILGEGSFLLAVTTSIAVFLHEVPDSISRAAAFMNAGASPPQAIRKVLLTTIGSFVGAILAVVLSTTFTSLLPYFTAVAAAAFLYIALSHLMPEMHQASQRHLVKTEIAALIGGVLVIVLLGMIE